jgi:hypothetical protein
MDESRGSRRMVPANPVARVAKALADVAPGMGFGQVAKSAVRFSQASSEEEHTQGPAPPSIVSSPKPAGAISMFVPVDARFLRSWTAGLSC